MAGNRFWGPGYGPIIGSPDAATRDSAEHEFSTIDALVAEIVPILKARSNEGMADAVIEEACRRAVFQLKVDRGEGRVIETIDLSPGSPTSQWLEDI